MARAHTVLELMLDRNPSARHQARELISVLPELVEELCGPEGVLWDGSADGVLLGLELLLRLTPVDEDGLWDWGLESMAAAGAFSWQSEVQHRQNLRALQRWSCGDQPPAGLRDICRRNLWMLRRHCKDIEQPPEQSAWLRALARFEELPAQLSALEFVTDTLDDEPDPDEEDSLHAELLAVSERVRAPLAELLVLNHLARAEAHSGASRWHCQHLGPLLQQRLAAG